MPRALEADVDHVCGLSKFAFVPVLPNEKRLAGLKLSSGGSPFTSSGSTSIALTLYDYIIVRTKSMLDKYAGVLRNAKLDTYPIEPVRAEDCSEPGVQLATMYRAKGLEFERVIIAGVNNGVVPHDRTLSGADDHKTKEQIRKHERSLFYVTATRAKDEVIVTSHDEPSSWLPLD